MVSGIRAGRPGDPRIDQQRTDSHVHVVSADRERFPHQAGGPGRDWWSGRDVDGDAVLADLDAAGVARAAIVQAVGAYGFDDAYAREVVARQPERLRLVPAVDVAGPDPAAALRSVLARGPVGGVRLFAVHADPAWLTDGRARALWDLAAEHGVTLVPTVFATHLPALVALLADVPDTTVAFDHCAFPDLTGGPPYEAAAPLWALAEHPSAHLKLSSVVLEGASAHGGAAALVEHLVAVFGAHRVCWGSDHPQTMELTYAAMLALAEQATDGLDPSARAAVLDGTARSLFGWDPS